MSHPRPALHRTILVVDVEGFGDPVRTNPRQVAVRDGLYRALRQALHAANIDWDDCHCEDRGDGVFVLAPANVPKAAFVESVPDALLNALRRHNSVHPAEERIRLRMVLHAGEVAHDDHGFTSSAINLAFRLVDAAPLRTALAESPGPLALITSSWFFDEVVRHSDIVDPATFRPIRVSVKETTAVGWISLPGHPYPPDKTRLDTTGSEHHTALSQPSPIKLEHKVAYSPALGRPVVVAIVLCAGWLVCWLLTLIETDGRWSATPCHRSIPYYCDDEWGLAALFLLGMMTGGVSAFHIGGHPWRVRLWPAWREPGTEWIYTEPTSLATWFGVALELLIGLIPGIASAIVGATRYAGDDQSLVAVIFLLTAIGAPVALAALSRAGYIWTLRNISKMLTNQRDYPRPLTSSTAALVKPIIEKVARRVLRPLGPLGKAIRTFEAKPEPDLRSDVLDALPSIPSMCTFSLAGQTTVVVVGRWVAVLACACWPPGRYARHGKLSVTRDGQPYHDARGIMASIDTVLDHLRKNLPAHAIVHAFIVVTTKGSGVTEFGNGTDPPQLIGAADARTVITNFLAEQWDVIDCRVAMAVWQAGPNLTGDGF